MVVFHKMGKNNLTNFAQIDSMISIILLLFIDKKPREMSFSIKRNREY